MNQTTNQGYNLVENTDEIQTSLNAWNANFNKIDADVTILQTNIKVLEDNFDTDTTPNSNNFVLEDSASGYNQGNIKIGDGPELEQNTTSISGGDEYDSPSPDHPQDIKVVEGASSANTSNKNKFDKASAILGKRIGPDGELINDNNYFTSDFIKASSNTDYTYSRELAGGGSAAFAYYDINKSFISRTMPIISSSAYYGTLSSPANAQYARICDLSTLIQNIQFEEGSIATPLVQHKGKSFDITLPEGMFLGAIGEASNYIYGTKDNWKLHRGLAKTIIDGDANITIPQTPAGEGLTSFKIQIADIVTAEDYCLAYSNQLRFTARTYVDWVVNQKDTPYTGAISASSNKQFLYCRLLNSLASNVTELKTFLSNNNLILYYQLATPTETPITDTTLITQLNNIADNLQTYKGQTIVFTTSENLEPNIQFDYMVNPLASIEARLDLLEG